MKFRKDIPVKLNPHPLYDNYGSPVPRHESLSRLGLQENYRYILFFGFIRAYKGLDLLIKAFADERFRQMNLKLLIAGEFYENPAPYLELIKKNNIRDEVILFNRFIGNEEIPLFFGAADLIVQPYRNATQSGVTQIAYYFGKPMLVTRVGGLSEIVPDGKCGYVTEAEPSSVAESIYDYFKNNRMDSFSECVREGKKNFTWDKMTAAILECYKNIS
jgi:glycosyltransferase involved in cell wall biosynthesis